MRTGLVVLMLAVIALTLFNPGMEDFRSFVSLHTERILRSEMGEGVLPDALARLGSGLAADHVDRVTERRNYVIMSTYTIDFDQNPDNENEWRFLGIAGQFFEIDSPE